MQRIREFFSSLSIAKIIRLSVLLIIIAAVPFTVIVSQQRQELRQHADEPPVITTQIFPWMDTNGTQGQSYIIITNPNPQTITAQVKVRGNTFTNNTINIDFNSSGAVRLPEKTLGGPVTVDAFFNATPTKPASFIATQRYQWGGSSQPVTEIPGTPITNAAQVVIFPWYDMDGTQGKTYIIVTNVNNATIQAHIAPFNGSITVGGHTSEAFTIPPEKKHGGPVQVSAVFTDGTPASFIASERSQWGGSSQPVTEIIGTPVNQASSDVIFPWYDTKGTINNSFVIITNVGEKTVNAQVTVHNAQINNILSIAPHTSSFMKIATPPVSPVAGGDLRVTATNEDKTPGSIIATHRYQWGGETKPVTEVVGVPTSKASPLLFFPWIDTIGTNDQSYIVVANPNDEPVTATFRIKGNPFTGNSITIPAHNNATAFHLSKKFISSERLMSVEAVFTATSKPAPVIASQRYQWGGETKPVTEVMGIPASTDIGPTPTATPTPGATTPTPTPTPLPGTPTPTPLPGDQTITLDLHLQLSAIEKPIGSSESGKIVIKHPTRTVSVCLYNLITTPTENPLDINCKQGIKISSSVTLDAKDYYFKNTSLSLGKIPLGKYQVLVSTPQYLRKRVLGLLQVPAADTKPIAISTQLTAGDINEDNKITVLEDYTILFDCFGVKFNTPSCKSHKTWENVDLDDNGVIDITDMNAFIRSLVILHGD